MTTVSEIFETMAYGPAPESDKPALEWIARHDGAFGLFIGGRWTKGKSDAGFDVINPATTARLARVTQAGQQDVDSAVAAARKAFPAWSTLSGHARARHLYALARAVQKHSRLLAVLESLDNGKSIRQTRDLDIPLVARHLTHHAGRAQLAESEFAAYGPEGVVDAIWFNEGQVCCAGSRLLVHEGIAERLVTKLRARMEKLRVGPPLDKAIDMGAIVAPVQLERIRSLVNTGVEEGATMWQPSWACPTDGYFYPPTLFTNVAPAATIAQVEIFGPVLVSMTFRTPAEAVELANNTPYGLAASVWTENINLALDVAPKIKAGVVWINCTNLFDAASGFGGYRESGFGREGGREGMWEYLKPVWDRGKGKGDGVSRQAAPKRGRSARLPSSPFSLPPIDRTYKMFIGGKQTRPDAPYARQIIGAGGRPLGEVGEGNRKDIRDAVEAARAAAGWAQTSGHARGQILYYIAENLGVRAAEFAGHIESLTGGEGADARHEVDATLSRLFSYAAWADKYDGAVHQVPIRGVTLAMNEPIGVLGLACPEECPLLGFVSLVAPAIATGNTVIALPSEVHPLAATELYTVLEASDVPSGVVNIVTGAKDALAKVLAEHDDVDGVWYFGNRAGAAEVERASAGNMKRTWVEWETRDWRDSQQGEGRKFLRQATQVKNIWIPYGE